MEKEIYHGKLTQELLRLKDSSEHVHTQTQGSWSMYEIYHRENVTLRFSNYIGENDETMTQVKLFGEEKDISKIEKILEN